MAQKVKLYRSRKDKIIFGLCGGLGEYFDVDPFLIRLLFVLVTFAGGAGVLVYIVLSIIIPEEPKGEEGNRNANMKKFVNEIGEKTQDIARAVKIDREGLNRSRNIFGAFVVLFGLGLLIQQFFPFDIYVWKVIGPALVILVGVVIVFGKKN